MVTKLDCLTRSLPDARNVADEFTRKGVALNLGDSVYDLRDPVGKLLGRYGSGKAQGRLRGKQPKLSKAQEAHVVSLHRDGAGDAGSQSSHDTHPRAIKVTRRNSACEGQLNAVVRKAGNYGSSNYWSTDGGR